ncbi:MAG: YceI family protein, partial [Chloroflexota bacterium]
MEKYWNRFRQYPLATQIMIGSTALLYLGWFLWLPFKERSPLNESAPPAASNPISANLEIKSLLQNSPTLSLESVRLFEIDATQSTASYIVDEEFLSESGAIIGRNTNTGFNTAIGTTNLITGAIAIDFSNDQPSIIVGEFSADMLGLTSIQPHRDGMLRRYWLESNQYPIAYFKTTGSPSLFLSKENETVSFPLQGTLRVRDITRPITFEVDAILNGSNLSGSATAVL